MTQIGIDPYTGKKLDFYGFYLLKNIVSKLIKWIEVSIKNFFEHIPMSSISWASEPDMTVLDALEDERDCTLKCMN